MIAKKSEALEKIRAYEAVTAVKDSYSENVRSIKNDFYDTLSRVIVAINPREQETMDTVVSLAQVTTHYLSIADEKQYEDDEIKTWFEDMYIILDRVLIDSRAIV